VYENLEISPTGEAVKKIGDTTSFSCVVFKFNLGIPNGDATTAPASAEWCFNFSLSTVEKIYSRE